MTSQSVDIFSMLNKAQTEYNQQQNSVAAFFRQASSNGNHNNNNGPTMRSMPLPINNMPMHSLSSLEQIERQIRTSPPSNRDSQNNNNGNGLHATQPNNNLGHSPLAQFFNSNNFNNAQQPRPAHAEIKSPKEKRPMNGHQQQQHHQKISAPPGFNAKAQQQQQQQQQPPQKNLLVKETKLITPTMFAAPSEKKQPVAAEPLTKNQLLQALNYLIENDDEFMLKIHQAYIKSFKGLSS